MEGVGVPPAPLNANWPSASIVLRPLTAGLGQQSHTHQLWEEVPGQGWEWEGIPLGTQLAEVRARMCCT